MSEIRERAQKYLDDRYPCGGDIITDLLAELERVEAENEQLKSDLSGSFFVEQIRQQAAMGCVEAAEYQASLFKPGSWDQQACLSVADRIKAKFNLEG